jgi:UDP-glucose 4-epimerase
MKIMVTGGNGFIGSNLIKRLLNEGYKVSSLDNLSTGLKEYEINGCDYHYGDIENIDLMDKDFDLVFHLAALSRIQPSFGDPQETFRVNTSGVQSVCEWAKNNNIKLVYAGSSSKWGDYSLSPYATYKKLGEDIIKMYRTVYGCDFEIARFYNVYGPRELVNDKWGALIGIWRYQIENKLPLTIVGDGEQTRDFTHVDDIVDGLIKIGFGNEKHEDAWELGTGKPYSINEVFEMFNKHFDVTKTYLPDQKGNYRKSKRVNDGAVNRLGWEPKDKLYEYVQSLKETNMLERILAIYEDEQLLIADGFDSAVIGIDEKSMRIIYSVTKCLQVLESQGMEMVESIEYFDFNVKDAYVGEKTPIWCEDFF